MHPQPKNIQEAAKLLDQVMPNWHKKININLLDMDYYKECILGQLYGEYETGLNLLFGTNTGWLNNPFGSQANKQDWIYEIQSRFVPLGPNDFLVYLESGIPTTPKHTFGGYRFQYLADNAHAYMSDKWYKMTFTPISEEKYKDSIQSLGKTAKLQKEKETLERRLAEIQRELEN